MEPSMPARLVVLLLLPALWPTSVLAADLRGIGVVTTLEGQAVVNRAVLSQQSLPLKFRDPVFFKDQISTHEHSIVRVLLKDKAVVTVRELSTLTITGAEESRRASVLDMLNGKVSLAVARLRMAPGESIEVRTPNAVVGVRGTFLVVEVTPAFTAQASAGQAATITTVYLLEGSVEVYASGAPRTPIPLRALQSVTISGDVAGQVRSIPPSAVAEILQGLTPQPQHTETPDEAKQAIKDQEEAKALTLVSTLTSGSPGQETTPESAGAITTTMATALNSTLSLTTGALNTTTGALGTTTGTLINTATGTLNTTTANLQNVVVSTTNLKLP